jgi:hypothetical protein
VAHPKAPQSDSDRRIAPREDFDPIPIRGFTSLDHMTILSRHGHIVEASSTGFLLHVERKELVPKQFRDNLALDVLHGDKIILMIDPLNLEISGTIARTRRLSKDVYEIAIDYTDDAPEYWRECLLEMLPRSADYD